MNKINIICFNKKFFRQKNKENIFYEISKLPFGDYNLFIYDEEDMKVVEREFDLEQLVEKSENLITSEYKEELEIEEELEDDEDIMSDEDIYDENTKKYTISDNLYKHIIKNIKNIKEIYILNEIISEDANLQFKLKYMNGDEKEYNIIHNTINEYENIFEKNTLYFPKYTSYYFPLEQNDQISFYLYYINIYSNLSIILIIPLIIFLFGLIQFNHSTQTQYQDIKKEANKVKRDLTNISKEMKEIDENLVVFTDTYKFMLSEIYKDFNPLFNLLVKNRAYSPISITRKLNLNDYEISFDIKKDFEINAYKKEEFDKIAKNNNFNMSYKNIAGTSQLRVSLTKNYNSKIFKYLDNKIINFIKNDYIDFFNFLFENKLNEILIPNNKGVNIDKVFNTQKENFQYKTGLEFITNQKNLYLLLEYTKMNDFKILNYQKLSKNLKKEIINNSNINDEIKDFFIQENKLFKINLSKIYNKENLKNF